MNEFDDQRQSAPPELRAELERSEANLAAGRVTALRPTLAAMHQRASRRLESRQAGADRRRGAEAG